VAVELPEPEPDEDRGAGEGDQEAEERAESHGAMCGAGHSPGAGAAPRLREV
jgi:hypothetical protein